MSELDTSAEAVERIAAWHDRESAAHAESAGYWGGANTARGREHLQSAEMHKAHAATLRALVVERTHARDEAAGWAGVAAGKDDVIRRLATVLSNLLTVTPAFPARNRQIVGMEDRYNKAIKEAKEVLGL